MDEKRMRQIDESNHKLVSAFEQRIRAEERESCANVCDEIRDNAKSLNQVESACACAECADAIRMRDVKHD